MLNVEGRVREDRRSRGVVRDSRATNNHLSFSRFGIVGTNADSDPHPAYGKAHVEPREAEEYQNRGKKVLSDDEVKARFGNVKRKGKMILRQERRENDGEWRAPAHAAPEANLTSRQRAQKMIDDAVHTDPNLAVGIEAARQHGGVDNGVFEAVRYVQRCEAARHVAARDTKRATLRSADEPSHLVAPFAAKTTQPIETSAARFSKRMLAEPEEPSPRAHGLRRVEADGRDIPFDTKVARFYPDPPKYGKGREIWEAQGKRRGDPRVAPHDLDEMAIRQAVARCGGHAAQEFPEFVLGSPPVGPRKGKNSSPQKNDSHFSLGNNHSAAAGAGGAPSVPRAGGGAVAGGGAEVSARSSYAAQASAARPNSRNGFAQLKNYSTPLW